MLSSILSRLNLGKWTVQDVAQTSHDRMIENTVKWLNRYLIRGIRFESKHGRFEYEGYVYSYVTEDMYALAKEVLESQGYKVNRSGFKFTINWREVTPRRCKAVVLADG